MAVVLTYHPEFPKRSLVEADIAACEADINVTLPLDLRTFLLAHDGPVPNPAWFPVTDAGGTKWLGPVADFKSVMGPPNHRARGNAIEQYTEASREGEKLPRHFVVIGSMLTQPSTLLISTGRDAYGHVFAWHVGFKRFKPDQLTYVAGSFTEFLRLLAEPPEEVAANFQQILQAHRTGTRQRAPEREYDGPEARRWLQRRKRNSDPLAANHFASRDSALQFVDELYAAGATKVIVPGSCIQDGVADDGGPYADALVVFLPADPVARTVICQRCERELDEPEHEPIDTSDPNPVFLWWD